jgi:acyl-CoA synthetase (AMP-forming)/AMP-acid ligase II
LRGRHATSLMAAPNAMSHGLTTALAGGLTTVRDVQVVGLPDERFGEELCAWIVLQTGTSIDAEDIRTFCRGQIAHFKVPRYIKFVDSFPTTTTGKVQKFVIKAAMIEELGLRNECNQEEMKAAQCTELR